MAIHAHPDDESSKGAGTVAKYAAAGVRCVLVTATGGEAGEVLNPALDTPEVHAQLAELRREELYEAAKIIGYDEVIELGYRDSGMPDTEANAHPEAFVNADLEDVTARLVRLVRHYRPEVILGYDDHERYPHPDHLRVHDLSIELFTAAADQNRFPDAGEAWPVPRVVAPVFTVKRLRALHDAAVARGLESPFERWMESLDGATDDGKDLVHVNVAEWLEVGRDALRAHRTQVDPDGFWFKLPLEMVADVYPYEDFEVLCERVPMKVDSGDLFTGL
ncbi:MAG TPA: mycothiol conjugate amidase Mca [Acidimicrobiia bacterium]|jgi:mycothiol S-conjugate amidase|nr:mycothiol conjugate amidase Mca [Acidimicrobiia bacterium]